jgi:hypothetical protein
MGGVRSASVVVECDRCKKDVMVTDDDQANSYREMAKAIVDDPDERMFVAILNIPGGEALDVDMQFVCPKCSDAIAGYMDKILMKKPAKKDKSGEEKKGEGEEKPKPDKKSSTKPKKGKEEKEEPAEEPETTEPAEEPDNQGEEEVDDDELFD